MDNRYRFIRTSNKVINEMNHFIDFRYSKHLTDVDKKKYIELLLVEKKVELLDQQLFLMREVLGRTMFNKIKHSKNVMKIKISRLKKKYI